MLCCFGFCWGYVCYVGVALTLFALSFGLVVCLFVDVVRITWIIVLVGLIVSLLILFLLFSLWLIMALLVLLGWLVALWAGCCIVYLMLFAWMCLSCCMLCGCFACWLWLVWINWLFVVILVCLLRREGAFAATVVLVGLLSSCFCLCLVFDWVGSFD